MARNEPDNPIIIHLTSEFIAQTLERIFKRLHRWSLIAVAITIFISTGLGGYGLIAGAPIYGTCFVVSAAFGIGWLGVQSTMRVVSLKRWLTYFTAMLGSALTLLVLFNTPHIYVWYFKALVLFLSEILIFAFWKNCRIGCIQCLVCVLLFVLPPVLTASNASVADSIEATDYAHLQILLALGANPNPRLQDDTALFSAIHTGRADIVQLLLDYGADPNSKADDFFNGTPALFDAAREQDVSMVDMLLRYGAKPDARNNAGETALFHAVRADKRANAQRLIDSGVDVNARDAQGKTALFSASSPDMITLLVAHGADIYIKDNQGRTALFDTAAYGNRATTEALMRLGLRFEEQNKK